MSWRDWLIRPVAVALTSGIVLLAQEQPVKFGTTVVIPGGLRGEVYRIRRNTNRLPDFQRLKRMGMIYTAELNVPPQDFRQGFPGVTKRFEWFAIDYSGRFWIEKPGTYQFALTSDDGAALYIDDAKLIDNDGHVNLVALKVFEKLCEGFGFRNEENVSSDIFQVHGFSAGLALP